MKPPRDDLERAIAGIFGQMLEVAPIGRDDDFFKLGGDAQSVDELRTRLRDTFGAGLSSPNEVVTVAGIAAEIRRHRATTPGAVRPMAVLIPLRRQGSKPPLFLVHGRLGQAFVSPHFLNLLGDDQPVWALQARGLDGLHEPHSTIEAMAADYVSEIRKLRPNGPYFLGALCAGTLIANVMARTLREAGQSVLPLLLFDPPEGPLQQFDLTEDSLIEGLEAYRATGRIAPELDDPVRATGAVRTAMAFEQALRKHRPQPYDGAVYMLCSRERIIGEQPSYLRGVFTGKVRRYEIAATHHEALDPHNPLFATYLERCLGLIRGAIKEPAKPISSRLTTASD